MAYLALLVFVVILIITIDALGSAVGAAHARQNEKMLKEKSSDK